MLTDEQAAQIASAACRWTIPPNDLVDWQRSLALASAAKTSKTSIAKVLIDILSGEDPWFAEFKTGFFTGNDFDHLLNVLVSNRKCRPRFSRWLRDTGHALRIVEEDLNREMNIVTKSFKMYTKDITPEWLTRFRLDTDVTSVLNEKAPTVRAVLIRTAQTNRALKENKKKDAVVVSGNYFCFLLKLICVCYQSPSLPS